MRKLGSALIKRSAALILTRARLTLRSQPPRGRAQGLRRRCNESRTLDFYAPSPRDMALSPPCRLICMPEQNEVAHLTELSQAETTDAFRVFHTTQKVVE